MQVEEAVAKAIRTKLTADLTCPVYDHPPRNAEMPFVTFDRHIVQPDNEPLAITMSRHQITLTIWSKERGVKQVRGIIGDIRTALHRCDLVLDVGNSALVTVERCDVSRDADGVTYMGSAMIDVLTNND